MQIDLTAAARRPDLERVRLWLAEQRVFISSAMGDTAPGRRAVAQVVDELGARPIWFEEFGRDADAEEAYLTEVDASTIYLGILNELYGRLNPPDGFSATEMEFMRAREGGKRVNVYVAAVGPRREGHLTRFIERVRFFVTTEDYADADDLARRVRRRLEELAAEALSPWVKLGDLVFRADEIEDTGSTITVRARASEEIAHQLEALRDQRYGRRTLRFVSRNRVVSGELARLQRTTRAAGPEELTLEVANAQPPQIDPMRAGTGGYTPDGLVELGLRALFLGEPLPSRLGMLHFMAETGVDAGDLRQAFELPNEVAGVITRLVVADGLVGSGRAARLHSLSLGPRVGDRRRIAIEWDEPRVYINVEPQRRSLEGEWARP
jgi:hypothetical protein